MPKTISKVVVLVAMEQELKPFMEKHQLKQMEHTYWPKALPMVAYEGRINKIDIHVVWAGKDKRFNANNVGTTASAISAYVAIQAFNPDLVISAGTAGGFGSTGGKIGDVYISTKCVFHARRIPIDGVNEEYGFGHFRSPPLLRLASLVGVKLGVVTTSDSLDHTPRDMQIMLSEGAVIKEMEAASIAWVCHELRVPFIAVKSVTDIVDGDQPTEDEFYKNLQFASEQLREKLTSILEHLSGTSLKKWSNFASRNSSL